MKKIVVASHNPVKIRAALEGFQRMFPGEKFVTEAVSVASGVNHQPRSDEETWRGAYQRVQNAAHLLPGADFWVGIEGGVEDMDGEMAAFAWVVVKSSRQVGKGRSGTFFLPHKVAELIRAGKELGEADDLVFQKMNSKQHNGAIGLLTGNVIDRAALYEQAVILALVPFKNADLYDGMAGKT
jgi:inosine/xanthosine triphosphatase